MSGSAPEAAWRAQEEAGRALEAAGKARGLTDRRASLQSRFVATERKIKCYLCEWTHLDFFLIKLFFISRLSTV